MENKKIKLPVLDFSKVEVVDMRINYKDAPDFCDSYVTEANYDGREATEDELDAINEGGGFVYESIMKRLYG